MHRQQPRILLVPAMILALTLALLPAVPALAASVYFTSLYPTADGAWQAVVDGKIKKKDELVIVVDGAEHAAEWSELPDGRRAATLEGVTADARRIAVGKRGKKGVEIESSLIVMPGVAPFGDWTIYHIMMGYFRNGNPGNDGQIDGWRHANYAGGDLQGVLEKADYLADLGVTAVWLSPLFQAKTSHGYDVLNYYRVGDAVAVPGDAEASLALLRQVIQELGKRGIRVVLDLPLNHAHGAYDREHGDPGGNQPRATGARQDAEKVWEGWNAPYRYWNFDHEPTRRFLKDAALYWLTQEGVAGLRLDYVRGVPHDFWAELLAEVEEKKPGAFLMGECWIDGDSAETNAREIARYYAPVEGQGRQFHSLIDFPMQMTATDVFARGGSAVRLEEWLQEYEPLYGEGAAPAFFLDNHDMSRFMAWTSDERKLLSAVGFLSTQSAPLLLFYGTETGLAHGAPKPGFTDASRVPMPWDGLEEKLIGRMSQYLVARRDHASLHAGGRVPLLVEKEALVSAKVGEGEIALVAVNLADEERTVKFEAGTLLDGGRTIVGVGGAVVPTKGEDGSWTWKLPATSTVVVIQEKSRDAVRP